jgi:hypothetical protein
MRLAIGANRSKITKNVVDHKTCYRGAHLLRTIERLQMWLKHEHGMLECSRLIEGTSLLSW